MARCNLALEDAYERLRMTPDFACSWPLARERPRDGGGDPKKSRVFVVLIAQTLVDSGALEGRLRIIVGIVGETSHPGPQTQNTGKCLYDCDRCFESCDRLLAAVRTRLTCEGA